jgi:hypothetical protein
MEEIKADIEKDDLLIISLKKKIVYNILKWVLGLAVLLSTSYLSFKTGFAVHG